METAAEQGYKEGRGDRSGVMEGGEVTELQWRKGEDLKEVWRDSQVEWVPARSPSVLRGVEVWEQSGMICACARFSSLPFPLSSPLLLTV